MPKFSLALTVTPTLGDGAGTQGVELLYLYKVGAINKVNGTGSQQGLCRVRELLKQVFQMPWDWPCPNKLVGPFPYYSVVFGPQLAQNKQPHNSVGIPGLQSNNFSERGGRVPEYRLTQHGSYRNQQVHKQGSVFSATSCKHRTEFVISHRI